VNEELRHRNRELSAITADLANVLASSSVPMAIVGSDLRLRRFTPFVFDPDGFKRPGGPERIVLDGDLDPGPLSFQYQERSEDRTNRGPVLRASADINDAPGTPTVKLVPDLGQIEYSGATTIEEIIADVDSAAPLFSDIKHVHAEIDDFPSGATLDTKIQGDGTVLFEGDQPLGAVDVQLRSTESLTADVTGPAGVTVRREGGEEIIHGLLPGLQRVEIRRAGDDLLTASVDLGNSVPFVADVRDDTVDQDPLLPFTAHLRIPALPSSVDVTVTREPGPAAGTDADDHVRIVYDASSSISEVELQAENFEPVGASPDFKGLNVVHALVRGIPSHLEVDLHDFACSPPAAGEPCGNLLHATTGSDTEKVGVLAVKAGLRRANVGTVLEPFVGMDPDFVTLPGVHDGVFFRQLRLDPPGTQNNVLAQPLLAARLSFLRDVRVDQLYPSINAVLDVDPPTEDDNQLGGSAHLFLPYPFTVDAQSHPSGDFAASRVSVSVDRLSPHMHMSFDSGVRPTPSGDPCEVDTTVTCLPMRAHFSSDNDIGAVTVDFENHHLADIAPSDLLEGEFPRKVHVEAHPSTSLNVCASTKNAACTDQPTDGFGDDGNRVADFAFRVDSAGATVERLCMAVTVCDDKKTHLSVDNLVLQPGAFLEYAAKHKLRLIAGGNGFARLRGTANSSFEFDDLEYHLGPGIKFEGDSDFLDAERVVDVGLPHPGASFGSDGRRRILLLSLLEDGTLNCPEDTHARIFLIPVRLQLCSNKGIFGGIAA
jgi:hypothetical protein